MSLAEQALSYVRAISPYQPGKPMTELARDMGMPVEQILKLASNENPLGMSPKAQAAVNAAISGISRYPDPFELVAKLAGMAGVAANQVVLGNGSNDVLDLIARVFLCAGRSAVFSQHAFAVYPLATMSTGAELICTPAKDFGHDLEAMLAAIRSDTRIVWIANPNNPTGNFLPYPALREFLDRVPKDVIVVLDEAYNEYIPPEARVDSAAWVGEYPNLVVCRTFSKIYGLAGLRVGYAMAAPEVADWMNRVRQPFNVNNLAIAGALAALDDHAFVAASYELNTCGKAQLVAGFDRLGLSYIPSYGNFVTFKVGDGAGVNQKLLQQGVIVRPIGGYGMPEWLRVTIGSEAENARFLDALARSI
ncbi:MAG: histidinol-phosphate transaminase [Azonexus sp.]|nr:histidinol-phosphate transaminase [Azonexus sp.]